VTLFQIGRRLVPVLEPTMIKKQEEPRPRLRKSEPTLSFGGWPQWPDNEDYSFEFMRVLATATEGASTVSECFRAARHIEHSNPASWYNAWTAVAARTKQRGDTAFESGGLNMATGNWLRASNYYRTAEVFLNEDDAQRQPTIDLMRSCSRLYLQHATPRASIVRIDDGRGAVLEGYFLPVSRSRPAAVVVCVGGMNSFKEDLLYTMRRHGAANELSLLLVDHPGFDPVAGRHQGSRRAETHVPLNRWLDYLLARADVDPDRIALYGDGLGAAYATEAATHDRRFVAAVCDGGLWEAKERSFAIRRMSGGAASRVGNRLVSPSHVDFKSLAALSWLTLVGQSDFTAVEDAEDIRSLNLRSGLNHDLKVFTDEETASAPGQVDNPTLAKEFAFDWLRQKLKSTRHAATKSEGALDC
jgi:dienelactone hydrolase